MYNLSISSDSVAYLNGRVYTVDKSQPWAEAFIVTPDAKFAAVGTTADISGRAKDAQLITVDLNGSFVMPGLHDSHVHTFHSGLHLLSDVNMDWSTNATNLIPRMHEGHAACAFHNTYSDWIIGVLERIEDYDRSLLDKDWPDNPVLIHGGGGHVKYLNTLGMERVGFDLTSQPDGNHSIFGRRPDGSLTGAVSGGDAMGQISLAVPRPSVAHVKRALKRAASELHRNGVTSVQEAAASRLFLEATQQLDREGDLKMQYASHILYRNEWLTGELRENSDEIIAMALQYKSPHVDTRFVKVMMDGAPFSLKPTTSNLTPNGTIDLSTILEANIGPNLQKWDKAGMSCKVHCGGDGAIRQTLDSFAELRESNPTGPRHEIAHCVSVQDDDFPRFRELNVTAEMSPAMYFNATFAPPTRGHNFPKMVEAQNLITVGSDWAFGMKEPLLPAVGHLVGQIGVERVLEMLTINGARSVGQDRVLGSISVGKTASFITVDRNLYEGDFENATVTKTWFEGEIVYDQSGLYI